MTEPFEVRYVIKNPLVGEVYSARTGQGEILTENEAFQRAGHVRNEIVHAEASTNLSSYRDDVLDGSGFTGLGHLHDVRQTPYAPNVTGLTDQDFHLNTNAHDTRLIKADPLHFSAQAPQTDHLKYDWIQTEMALDRTTPLHSSSRSPGTPPTITIQSRTRTSRPTNRTARSPPSSLRRPWRGSTTLRRARGVRIKQTLGGTYGGFSVGDGGYSGGMGMPTQDRGDFQDSIAAPMTRGPRVRP